MRLLLPAIALLLPSMLAAQGLPAEPVTLAGGRITIGGEVTATVAPDDPGRFNLTDYERSALQLLRFGLTAAMRPFDRVTLVTELRAEGDTAGGEWTALPFAAYVRVRPWKDLPLHFQAGRIPPVFGAAGRRIYASDNVLIGYPLAWQYLTVLRSDAVPWNANELIYARGFQGWKPNYSVGADGYAHGVPLATAFRYDTGVEAQFGDEYRPVSVAAAITAGTLSSPGARRSNGGPQLSTRAAFRPIVGLVLGGSFAQGAFVAESVESELPAAVRDGHYTQRSIGADAEYSIGHFLGRAELVTARWRLPVLGSPALDTPLWSTGISVEGRYRLLPALTVAARVDHLGFNRVMGSYTELAWDAPVSRIEAGLAWKVTRNVIVRGSVQHDQRQRGLVRHATLPALQATLWF
jgi:hypothetical protein